ncbi:MAG: hypothetical protein GXX84_03635 [Acidobacteria bacterium]|nr:hypothetical protein [Acidobacteriota bacterium]
MDHVHVRVYEELNDRLPPDRRKRRFPCPLPGITNVRQLLARLGVPESEVELVLINGESSSFSDTLRAGDFVSLYPVFESLDVSSLIRTRREPLRRLAFMVDQRLEPLAARLRSLEFDVQECKNMGRSEIARIAEEEKRIFLARSGFVDTADLSRLFILRQQDVELQLMEVLTRFDLI